MQADQGYQPFIRKDGTHPHPHAGIRSGYQAPPMATMGAAGGRGHTESSYEAYEASYRQPFNDNSPVKFANMGDPYHHGYGELRGPYGHDVPVVPVIAMDDEEDGTHCTDFHWFGSFSGCFAVVLTIMVFALIKSDPSRLMTFPNYRGDYCGVDADVRGNPYLYYPLDPAARGPKLLLHAAQCVSECPGLTQVGRAMPVPMMQMEFDEANPATSGITVRYTVHSPMYATDVEGGNLCLPVDRTLRKEVLGLVSTPTIQIQRLFGSIANAWPAMVRDIGISLIVFAFISQIAMNALPGLTLNVLVIGLECAILACGGVLTWWGFREAYTLPYHYAALYSLSPLMAKIGGVIMLGGSISCIFFILANWGVLWEGTIHYDALKEVVKDLAPTILAPAILSGLSIITLTLWCRWMTYLSSYSVTLPIDAGQSQMATPFFMETVHLRLGVAIAMIFLTAFFIWTLYLFRSVARFSGTYVGVVWFFAPTLNCDCDERDVSGSEGLIALQQAFTVSFGTNAMYGALMNAVEPVKAFFAFASRRKSPHFTPADGDQLSEAYPTTTPAEASEVAQWIHRTIPTVLPGAAAVCDFFHSAALTEVILSGNHLLYSMDGSRKRLVMAGPLYQPTIAGRYIGSYSLVGQVISLFVALCGALSTFISVSSKSVYFKLADDGSPRVEESIGFLTYSLPGSSHFVANPIAAAAIVFTIVYLVTDIFTGFVEGIVDSVTYCYVVDIQSLTTSVHDPTRFAPVKEHPCHVRRAPYKLKNLLTQALETEVGYSSVAVQGPFEGVPGGAFDGTMRGMRPM